MMNEETKAALNEFLKKREERIKNMTLAEAKDIVSSMYGHSDMRMESDKALQMLLDCADKVLEQQPIDKSAMMYEIYMKGVNMTGEYQGCWVRFKDIEKIVDKYMTESEDAEC